MNFETFYTLLYQFFTREVNTREVNKILLHFDVKELSRYPSKQSTQHPRQTPKNESNADS